jgi:ABC-2 type transport system ATP-binding protein
MRLVRGDDVPAIEVDGLSKVYPGRRGTAVAAVDDVTFSVRRGEVVGLLGANGAGKTTIIKCLSALVRPTAGSARVAGIDTARRPRQALRHVASVLEGNRNIYWRLTPRENLRFFAGLHGLSPRRARPLADELLERFDLVEKRDRQARTLSRGMQQKLALACALVKETDVLLLDEPTLGLDVETTYELRDYLRRLAAEGGRTLVVSSHDLHLVQAVCERVVVIHRGRLVTDDSVANLLGLLRATGYRLVVGGVVDEGVEAELRRVAGPLELERSGRTATLAFDLESPEPLLDLMNVLRRSGLVVERIENRTPDLEQVFLNIVRGKENGAQLHAAAGGLRTVLD